MPLMALLESVGSGRCSSWMSSRGALEMAGAGRGSLEGDDDVAHAGKLSLGTLYCYPKCATLLLHRDRVKLALSRTYRNGGNSHRLRQYF